MKNIVVAVILSLCAGWAQADSALSVEGGWVRWVPPVSANSAAYFMLHNNGSSAMELIGADSDIARAVELHTVITEGELMRMQPLEKLAVPADDCVLFKPGSHHVMLIGLKQPLREGQEVELTLRFANGDTLPVKLTVKNEGEDEHAHHHSEK